MGKSIITGLLFFISFSLSGQVGASVGFKSFQAEEWLSVINQFGDGSSHTASSGLSVSLDYRIRIKDIRLEFYPELSYSALKNESAGSNLEYALSAFHLNTNLYIFDLEGDCDCPTWSKSGNLFQKGFFLQVSPGINYFSVELNGSDDLDKDADLFWDIGFGAGLDLGITEFFTLTPTIRYYVAPGAKWSHQAPLNSEEMTTRATAGQFFAGIRLGVHL